MPKNPQFSITLFITASLATFVIWGLFYSLFVTSPNYGVRKIQPLYSSPSQYYLNNNYNEGNPLITKRPSPQDMLAGPIISSSDPGLGDEDAPITIVEFSDFVCNFCYQQEQVIKKLGQKYENRVRLIWKDYPENDWRSASFQAALAARCADEQDKFWPYHDLLFDRHGDLKQEAYYDLAGSLDLDLDIFKSCLDSARPKNLIDDNRAEANALDIIGVPFIYINDQEVMGEINLEELERIVRIELDKMKTSNK